MTSPDVSPYVSLDLYDVSPSDLFERALLDLGVKLPDWTPRDGNTEVVLMESLSLTVAEMVYAINRLPGALVEGILKLYGVDRSPGLPATATVTFDLTAPIGYDIPAGATFSLALGDEPLLLTLDTAVAVPPGATTATGAVTATRPTSSGNGTAAGTELTVLTALPYVDRVRLTTALAGGSDQEDTDTWLTRGVQRLRRLTSTLNVPLHFEAAALEHPEVLRAHAVDNFDGTSTNPGHITIAVLGTDGTLLSDAARAALLADLDGRAQANLGVHVVDPTITSVDVRVTVAPLPGFTAATIVASVQAALAAYLSSATHSWGGIVTRNQLVGVISRSTGVDYVAALVTPATDVVLAGAVALPRAGTITVDVA